jgi:hypothetical protein
MGGMARLGTPCAGATVMGATGARGRGGGRQSVAASVKVMEKRKAGLMRKKDRGNGALFGRKVLRRQGF